MFKTLTIQYPEDWGTELYRNTSVTYLILKSELQSPYESGYRDTRHSAVMLDYDYEQKEYVYILHTFTQSALDNHARGNLTYQMKGA